MQRPITRPFFHLLVGLLIWTPVQLAASLNLFPLAFYTAETSVALGGAVTLNSGHNPLNNLASIAYFTFKGQFQISGNGSYSWKEGLWRLEGDMAFSRYPNRLYSIGQESPSDYGQYTQLRFQSRISILKRIKNWYIGPMMNLAFYRSNQVEPALNQTPSEWTGFERAKVFGLGLSLIQDRRDHPFDPRRGHYTRFLGLQYLGLNPTFSRYFEFKFDHRRYIYISKNLSWASALHFHYSSSAAPYPVLSGFGDQGGSVRVMRGFFNDRFRDRTLLAFQSELRIMLSKRWLAQVFTDIGQVATTPGQLKLNRFRLTFGAGIGFIVSQESRLPVFVEAGRSSEGLAISVKPMASF